MEILDYNGFTPEELAQLAEEWLKENDPYYTNEKSNKRQELEYNYETERQIKYRRKKEIEFNRLFTSGLVELLKKNVGCVGEYFLK